MFGASGFGDYDADDDRDYEGGDGHFVSGTESGRRRRRSNMFGDQRHERGTFEFGDQRSTDGFANPNDAFGEQFRRGVVDDDVNDAYVSFDRKRITDADAHHTPLRDYAGDADHDNAAGPKFRPTRKQMDDLFSAIGSSSSTASSTVPSPLRPANNDAQGATASSSSFSASDASHRGRHRTRRRRKRKTSSMSTSSTTSASATAESLGSATTTSATEQEFLFSDEESPRARRRARKESRAPPPPPAQDSASKDKSAANAMTIKYAPLNDVQKANDERAYGAVMAHDIELDMDDSSCDELERQLVGRRLRDETLRAARAEEGYTQADRLRDQDSSASATDELMAGRMRSLNVRDRQLFVSTDDESDTSQNPNRQAAKRSFGPDEILAKYALPGTASGAGQAMNCFICGYTRENAPIVPNRDLRQLLELFYNPNGTDLKRHARAVHVFYKTRIWRNAEWRQQNLPLWRTRDVYVCLTKHQVEPRLVMRKHLTMIDTMIQSTAAAANLQAASGQVVPHRDNVRLFDVLLNRYWNLARIDPSKTNFYQARATPSAHAPGPYHVQTVRARMTTTTTMARGGGGNQRNRFY